MRTLFLLLALSARLAATDFYSQGSLAPDLLSSWNSAIDGSGSAPANFTSGDAFRVQGGHSMTTSAAWAIAGTGSKLWIENGGFLTAAHVVTLATASVFQIDNGGTFVQNAAMAMATSIFQGTEAFAAASNFEVRVWPSAPATPTAPGYGNFTMNAASGNCDWMKTITTVQGNFNVMATGGAATLVVSLTGYTLNVAGDFSMSGGTLSFANGNVGSPNFNVAGNFNLTGGTFSISGTQNGSDRPSLNVSGNYSQTAGTLYMTNCCGGTLADLRLSGNFSVTGGTITRNNGASRIILLGSAKELNLKSNTPANGIDFTIAGGASYQMKAGSFLDMGNGQSTFIFGELDFAALSPAFSNLYVRGGTIKGTGSFSGVSPWENEVCNADVPAGATGAACSSLGANHGLIDLSGTANYSNGATLTLKNGGELRLAGTAQRTGNGSFTLATTGGTLSMEPSTKLAGSGAVTINTPTTPGTAIVKIGSTAGITATGATGNIQNTSTRSFGAADYTYNGTAAQATGSGLPATVGSLTIDNPSGLTLANDIAISTALNLTNGILQATAKRVSVNAAASVTGGSSTSYVNVATATAAAGMKRATGGFFPIGDGTAGWYLPISISNSGTADNFSVRLESLTGGLDNPAKAVQRQWNIAEDVAGGSSATVVFNYPAAAVGGNYDQAATAGMGLHYTGGVSVPELVSIVPGGEFSANYAGISSFSPFTIGSFGALPLEWVAVGAKAAQGFNKISWQTAQEAGLKSFFVEKSGDGSTDWQPIFETPATNRSEPTDYFFEEKEPDAATFYRIRSLERDGRSDFSKIVFVERKDGDGPGFHLLENPVGEVATLVFGSKKEGPVDISVIDMMGKPVFQSTTEASDNGETRFVIDCRDWPPGAYFLTSQMDKAVFSQKFIKN